ncbi:ABC transporter substrate-binding protein [Bradyrhizobium sp. WYCCWR 13022]|uniref:ABC transporter substrate-binding protein n=1 Tax=unclassified Bradyrhizobium TaxID=2631580 RepID=UPI00263A6539|nr:ABC transporter substrate-binding protein [Bradyrhizobium sp. WYCCWR 13022]MDN4988468.1 ABC transporter substrate-binding protein [Bradyrhizobium sp. WYCCWR 13022]
MRRRDFVAGAASLAVVSKIAAQPVSNTRTLALVDVTRPEAQMREDSQGFYGLLLSEIRRLGHIEGQNLKIERYGKEQSALDASILAANVVRGNPDVMLVLVPFSAVSKATSKIPIVTMSGDPVAAGYAQSLARPGGNITGVSVDAGPSIHSKRIALLREMFPPMSKLGCIAGRIQWERGAGITLRAAAETAGVSLVAQLVDIPGNAATYRNAIEAASREGADAIMMLDNPDMLANRVSIAQALAEARIPAIHAFVEAVDAGGLMAYSFDFKEVRRRLANDIDAILRGANPAEIPYYQVSKFELSVNIKAASALGLTVPPTLLASADKVVE